MTTNCSRLLTRRDFLRLAMLSGGGLLAACVAAPTLRAPTRTPAPTATPPARPINPGEVTVAAGRPLGDAAQIGDFLGAGGGMEYLSTNPDDPVVQAWRSAGFRHASFETLHVEGDGRWYEVTRDDSGALRVGFDRYDRYLASYLDNLQAEPFVYLGNMPRALSSQPDINNDLGYSDYSTYMPRDLQEWEQLCAAIVRHNVETFGLRGLAYGAPGEPDYPGNWLYAPGEDPATQLPNSIALYAATWRGVKSADPTARLGGPATMNWQITPNTGTAVFTLADWIRELAAYNASAGSEAVGLDFIAWQDYAWSSERIHDGAEAVSRFLAESGFDPNIPKMLAGSGWGSWCSDYLDESLTPHRRASHALHNIIREFKDPRRRQFALALYYFFYELPWFGGDGNRIALVIVREDGTLNLTPLYAAFQMASAMAAGNEIVECFAPEPLEAMAVRNDSAASVIITLNNHTPDPVTAPVAVWGLPFNSENVWRGAQVIDEFNSRDGSGLQEAAWDELPIANPLNFPVTLGPYASLMLSLHPA